MEFDKYSKEQRACFVNMFQLLEEVAKAPELTDEIVAKGEELAMQIFHTGYTEGYNSASKIYNEMQQVSHEPYLDYHIRGFGHGLPEGYCEEIIRK